MGSVIKNNTIIISNPISNKVIDKINITSDEKIDEIIQRSKNYDKWSSLSINERCKKITIFRKEIVKNKDEILKIIVQETGKKEFDAFIELFTVLEHCREITKIAKKSLRNKTRSTGLLKNKKAYVQYEPLGIAGIISPWNFPLVTPFTASIDALLAGNNVILKPSEHTPLTSMYMKKLWDSKVGYNDAWNIVYGSGQVGEVIVNSKYIDIISFTGSTKVGKKIAKKCSEVLKPVILELGGKDPMIILEDANIDRAIKAAIFGGLYNAGQACISVEEIYIENSIFNKFSDCIKQKVSNMSAGENSSDDIGAIITKENYNKINMHLDEISEDEKISGSVSTQGMFIAPTIVTNAGDNTKIINEETFGPVISLRSFENEIDLIEKIHKTGYGLAGSIFGKNKKRIHRIISKIKTGNISINDVFTHYGITSLPFGGEGNSGLGRLHGKEGLRSFSRVKSIVENKYTFFDEPWWFNRKKSMEKFLSKAISFYKW